MIMNTAPNHGFWVDDLRGKYIMTIKGVLINNKRNIKTIKLHLDEHFIRTMVLQIDKNVKEQTRGL